MTFNFLLHKSRSNIYFFYTYAHYISYAYDLLCPLLFRNIFCQFGGQAETSLDFFLFSAQVPENNGHRYIFQEMLYLILCSYFAMQEVKSQFDQMLHMSKRNKK